MLTSAQERGLLAICDAGADGLTAEEIGHSLHGPRIRHQFAKRIGESIGVRLEVLRLVDSDLNPERRYRALYDGRALAEELRGET